MPADYGSILTVASNLETSPLIIGFVGIDIIVLYTVLLFCSFILGMSLLSSWDVLVASGKFSKVFYNPIGFRSLVFFRLRKTEKVQKVQF